MNSASLPCFNAQVNREGGVAMIDRDEKRYMDEEARREAKYDSISDYLETQSRIKKEVARLKRLF